MTTKTKQPTSTDLKAVDRILLYVSGTKEKSLKLASTNGVTLHAIVDASYACHEDFKSHSGCTVHVGNLSGSLLTKSKKQKFPRRSDAIHRPREIRYQIWENKSCHFRPWKVL